MSLYTEFLAAGIPTDNHESDLYVLATDEAWTIIRRSQATCDGFPRSLSSFVSQIDGRMWLDIPFAFDPFWARRTS